MGEKVNVTARIEIAVQRYGEESGSTVGRDRNRKEHLEISFEKGDIK